MLSYEMLLDLGIILLVAKIFGILFRKIQLPQVVGILVAGLVIGPNILGIVHESDFIVQMAELGVIMLMFTAGLETDLKELKKTGVAALVIALLGVIVPVIGGYVTYGLFYGFSPVLSAGFYKAIFIGVIITATSVGITVETLREMGKLKGSVGTAILSAAIIDDVIGIILLTFMVGLTSEGGDPKQVVINTLLFFVLAGVGGFILNKLFQYFDRKYPHRRRIPIYGFALCLLLAYVAEHYFGIADITGAYVAGLILCNIRSSEYIMEKIDVNAYMIFNPVFFASIGLKTQIEGITPAIIVFTVGLIVISLLTKIVGCGLGAKMCNFDTKDSLRIGVGMMARGEVALVVAQKGLNGGLMDASLFTPIILLVIVSSIITPIILKLLYKDKEKNRGRMVAAKRAVSIH
jgi:Kef-type K+ transport system membrane component KefB